MIRLGFSNDASELLLKGTAKRIVQRKGCMPGKDAGVFLSLANQNPDAVAVDFDSWFANNVLNFTHFTHLFGSLPVALGANARWHNFVWQHKTVCAVDKSFIRFNISAPSTPLMRQTCARFKRWLHGFFGVNRLTNYRSVRFARNGTFRSRSVARSLLDAAGIVL